MFVNWKRLLLAVYRLEEGQQEILARLERREQAPALQKDAQKCADEWIQSGIDNILSYSVEKKKEE